MKKKIVGEYFFGEKVFLVTTVTTFTSVTIVTTVATVTTVTTVTTATTVTCHCHCDKTQFVIKLKNLENLNGNKIQIVTNLKLLQNQILKELK